jgi:hypothetical protein
MRKRYVAALAGLALLGTAAAPSVASAASGQEKQRHCAEEFHAAVVEDNEAPRLKRAVLAHKYAALAHRQWWATEAVVPAAPIVEVA